MYIQAHAGLTENQTLKVASGVRIATENRNIVQPGLRDALIENNKRVDGLFSSFRHDEQPVVGYVTLCIMCVCMTVSVCDRISALRSKTGKTQN